MAAGKSRDEAISARAATFAGRLAAAAALASTEEDIRIATEKQLAFLEEELGITLVGKHEYTVASGRIDSVYQGVIVEYKNPNSSSTRIGPNSSSPGSQKVISQIQSRFDDLSKLHKHPLNRILGVGLDGRRLVFVRFRDGKWHVQEPVELTKHSAERLLWALLNLGAKGKPYTPEYLAEDFGASSIPAQSGVRILYDAIKNATSDRTVLFFKQWRILFGEVCGYDVASPSDKIKKLAESYGLPLKGLRTAELLFAIHTYYAIFMKLLASEVVAYFHKLPTPLQKILKASSSKKLQEEVKDLEAGSIFRHLNITNFLEGDLFAWYLDEWSSDIEPLYRELTSRLDNYSPATLSEDPAGSRDLLKHLYQELFPRTVRHDLGEYYTPDWLAEHVLEELGYRGDPRKRLLDPACGSGTFLVMAINRVKAWVDENRETAKLSDRDLMKLVLSNIVGFDLNPLAVMAARTNYLIAIRDLIGHVDQVELPVYLCDSIVVPSEYGDLFQGGAGGAKELRTAAARFLIPAEITSNRDLVAKYAQILESSVKNGYSPADFVARCKEEGLPISLHALHIDLYKELVQLDKANKNGIWARIIKNAFAPLFTEKADYIAGNPPWINWNNLPSEYRDASKPIWQKYNLWPKYLLGASADFSKLFFYVCADKYLAEGGKLGFVITQSVFKTYGGNLFRQFTLPDGSALAVTRVDDMVDLQPFEGATNRTATMFVTRNTATSYPVKYEVWTTQVGRQELSSESLSGAVAKTARTSLVAVPMVKSDRMSPWLTAPKNLVGPLRLATGKNAYESFIGIHTYGANGVYFMDKLGEKGPLWLVQNDIKGIKSKPIDQEAVAIESALLTRLLRGRNVQETGISIEQLLLFPYKSSGEIIEEAELKTKYPRAYAYLLKHKSLLESRSEYVRRGRKGLWYQLFCIYPETFTPHKVVWREQASTLRPGLLLGDGERPVIPDHKLMFIPCSSTQEAYFLLALLSSSICRAIVESVAIETQNSTRVMDSLKLPQFQKTNPAHVCLTELGVRMTKRDSKNATHEADVLAAEVWGLAKKSVLAMQRIVAGS